MHVAALFDKPMGATVARHGIPIDRPPAGVEDRLTWFAALRKTKGQ
jgi:hypothetical protein